MKVVRNQHGVPAEAVNIMLTKTLVRILEPFRPCSSGVEKALEFRTVEEWFNSPDVPLNHKMYVWLCVACADSDNVFAEELANWKYCGIKALTLMTVIETRHNQTFSESFRLDHIGYVGACKNDSVRFSKTFRCPTDAEIRMISRWVKRIRKRG